MRVLSPLEARVLAVLDQPTDLWIEYALAQYCRKTAPTWLPALQDGRLRMQVSLLQSDVPRWEQLLASIARKHDVPFTVALKLRTAPAGLRGRPP